MRHALGYAEWHRYGQAISRYASSVIDDAFVEGFGHHIIRLLRTEREKRGISMNQLAHESGLAQSTVSRVENELRIPSLDTLLRIAAVIDVKIEDVIADARRVASKKR